MRIFTPILTILLLLSGCSLFPGMQDPDISMMHIEKDTHKLPYEPVVIPITPLLLIKKPPPCYIYRVAPQDVLSIVVWQHPEFNTPTQLFSQVNGQSPPFAGQSGYLVNYDGRIYFPLVGYLYVADKTTDQIRKEITAGLREYIRHPQVVVRVSDFRSKKVYVLGEVRKPMLLPLNDQPMSITDALMLAGSFDSDAANPSQIYIIRGSFVCPEIYWLNAKSPDRLLLGENFQLQPGDIIYVSTATVTRWNRLLTWLLPTVQTIWYTKAVTGK